MSTAKQPSTTTPTMTKKERVTAALRGQPVDRAPISFWGHNYLKEWSAEGLAEAMLENYHRYGWDWMKVNPARQLLRRRLGRGAPSFGRLKQRPDLRRHPREDRGRLAQAAPAGTG